MRFVPIAVLGVAAAFLGSLDAAVVRHASVIDMSECSIRQLLSLPRQVDVLTLGSSRVRAGISTQAIEQASGGVLRGNFNFGRSGLSTMRSYVTLRDAIDRGVRPRFVFMEVDLDALEDVPSHTPIRAPEQAAFMTYADLDLMRELPDELGPATKARLVLLTLLGKVRESIIPALSGTTLHAPFYRPGAALPACQMSVDFGATPHGQQELAMQRRAMAAQFHGLASARRELRLGAMMSFQRRQELFFIGKARELARSTGAVFVVARHGAADEPPLSDAAVGRVRRDIPEFIQPPESVFRASWPDYLDAYHMGPKGRDAYSAWLAERLMAAAPP